MAVDPDALAQAGSTKRTLVVGADVSLGERIVTGPTGKVQIVFTDQTRLVVGPGSSLVIEKYLMNGNKADAFAINALAGTFRFLSGRSPKPAYSIDTPTAAIAVRGTKFDFSVQRGQTQVMLYEGALSLCRGANCVDLTDRCAIGIVGNGSGQIGWGQSGHTAASRSFPLAAAQSRLLGDFRVTGANACTRPPQNQTPSSLSTMQPRDDQTYSTQNQ